MSNTHIAIDMTKPPLQTASDAGRRNLLLGVAAGAISATASSLALAAVPGDAAYALAPAGDSLTPFKVSVPQAALDDLKRRLRSVRYPEHETASDWKQGVPLEKAKALIDHWRQQYNWRAFEARINAHPQFRTRLDGLGIHFLHVRSKHPGALPIIMTHGWPGSVVEFMKSIGPLVDPTSHGGSAKDAFDVVVPSLPGFGWSDKPRETGWNADRTARAWAQLMSRLGYTKWVAQGGDWGSSVTHALGRLRPQGLVAAHVNWPFVFPSKMPDSPSAEEAAAFQAAGRFLEQESGYFKVQTTRPQTIGYALADSPAGQAMWIYEKFRSWTDNSGSPEDALSVTEMLDNISLYWFTNTAASSARFYWENSTASYDAGRIELPMGASIFPKEIYRAPKKWAEAHWPNLFYWNEVDRGGHFAAFEQPTLFAGELRKAFSSFR